MESKYDMCYIKFKYCKNKVVVSIVSGKRDWCVVVCRNGVCSEWMLTIVDVV